MPAPTDYATLLATPLQATDQVLVMRNGLTGALVAPNVMAAGVLQDNITAAAPPAPPTQLTGDVCMLGTVPVGGVVQARSFGSGAPQRLTNDGANTCSVLPPVGGNFKATPTSGGPAQLVGANVAVPLSPGDTFTIQPLSTQNVARVS